MKRLAIQFTLTLFVTLSTFAAEARSRCDVEYYTNGYFYVTRDRGTMSGAYTELRNAARERDQLVYQGLCERRPAFESTCDVRLYTNGYFYVTRNGATMSGAYSSSSSAIQARNERLNLRLCVARRARQSRCDVQRYTNGYYYVTRDGATASRAYSEIRNAIQERNQFIAAGMCVLR